MVVSDETAAQILERLELGQRVALLASSRDAARQVWLELQEAMEDEQLELATTRRAHGAEQIRLGDGRLTFHSMRRSDSLRGMSLDAIYIPADMAGLDHSDLLPCLNVSAGPLLTYRA